MDLYHLVVFLHIAGVFGFLVAHGASINMLFRLRREQDPVRVCAFLDLSAASYGGVYASLLLLIGAGVLAGFMGNWWGQGWIWVALGILLVLLTCMTFMGSFFYARIRKASGLPYMLNFKPQPPQAPAPPDELAGLLHSSQPIWLAWIGIGGLGALLWLMIFKPF